MNMRILCAHIEMSRYYKKGLPLMHFPCTLMHG